MGKVVARLVPALSFIAEALQDHITGLHSQKLSSKPKMIPLPVYFLNEQKYQDVVNILDNYEELVTETYGEAEQQLTDSSKVHIGGDQLTRERFSGAKRLRAHHENPSHRFTHLGPITFEFFHMMMNLQKVLYKHLYKESSTDLGTMKSLQERIRRSSVKLPVKDHYDSDKDFAVSFVHAYIVEAVLDYFGMEDVNSTPTKNFPPHMSLSPCEVKQWFTTHFTNIVNQYVNHQENEYANVEGYGGFVILNVAKEKLPENDPLDTDGIYKTSRKSFTLRVDGSDLKRLEKYASIMESKDAEELGDDSDSSSENSVETKALNAAASVSKQPKAMRDVFLHEHTAKYRYNVQEGFPLVGHSETSPKTHGKYTVAAMGGRKNDIALDMCLRAQIDEYPDPMCDCACPFLIDNITRYSPLHTSNGKLERKYVIVFLLSLLFVFDDFGHGHTHQWYDIMMACLISVPYITIHALLVFAEYSCICKAKSVFCCCNPDGCGNCCGLTCKNLPLCNADRPKWNCTRCETWDPCLLCCRRKCVCMVLWACICFKCGLSELCCHKCCPAKCCCGKDGNCGCLCVCNKIQGAKPRLVVFNVFQNIIIPMVGCSFASACGVLLDERLENAVPVFIYLVLEVLTYPSVLFCTEAVLHYICRKTLSLIEDLEAEDDED